MQFLNLSPNEDFHFEPSIDRGIIQFPSGFESTIRINCDQVLLDTTTSHACIVSRIESSSDIFLIAQTVDSLRRKGFKTLSLFLPFVPNARQDRPMVDGDSFGLKVFANFINSLGFVKVWVFDPHSNVTTALIENCEAIPASIFALEVLKNEPRHDNIVLCAPDAGSLKKGEAAANASNKPLVFANKKRDPKTGMIRGTEIFGDVKDKVVYILDDICDGGATFIGLAEELKKQGAKEISLIVSHGLFTKGLDNLWKAGIDFIYTTNSFDHSQNLFDSKRDGLMVYNLRDLLLDNGYFA